MAHSTIVRRGLPPLTASDSSSAHLLVLLLSRSPFVRSMRSNRSCRTADVYILYSIMLSIIEQFVHCAHSQTLRVCTSYWANFLFSIFPIDFFFFLCYTIYAGYGWATIFYSSYLSYLSYSSYLLLAFSSFTYTISHYTVSL